MNRLRLQFPESRHGWLSLAAICLLQTGCATLHPATEVTATRSMLTEIAATEAVPAQPVFDALHEITENTLNGGEAPTAVTTANRQPLNFTMQTPAPLQWKNCALSAGGRSLQYCTTGDGTFRTLIIGSTLGNDPAAVELTEKLATHLHDNSLIYGGFQVLVIRTLNPDGAAENKPVNAFGQIINRQFPSESNGPVANCPEAELLMRLIQNERPDRILHIRTIQSPVGALGSDSGAAPLAATVAQSLSFTRFLYPRDIAAGTLEHHCSSRQISNVITFAFPNTLSGTEAWDRYADCLITLIRPRTASVPPQQATPR